jgi:hypothetical protein
MDGGVANPRAWTPIRVCGRDVALVPTNRAVQQIEVRLGVGMPGLLGRFFGGDIRIRDLNIVVDECLKGAGFTGKDGGGSMFEYDQIGEDILAHYSAYCVAVGSMLGQVFGAPDPKGAPAPSAPEPPQAGPSSSGSP